MSDITTTRTMKKAITPKQKKVTVLSVVGPARPTPLSASAAGAAISIVARTETSAAAVLFTGGNLLQAQASMTRFAAKSSSFACENPVNAGISTFPYAYN